MSWTSLTKPNIDENCDNIVPDQFYNNNTIISGRRQEIPLLDAINVQLSELYGEYEGTEKRRGRQREERTVLVKWLANKNIYKQGQI